VRPLEAGLSLRSWRLERRLGVGSAGEVWLARDGRGAVVALKASPRLDNEQEQAFRREFEQLRTLRLPNVVRVFDCGGDQGYIFFTMDVAEGEPFDKHVQRGSSLASRVRRLASAGAQVARALASIHRLELAHRDIKPANVHVSPDGRATVLDFGTARFGTAPDQGELVGTAAYMAPEQRVGLPHDHRVDLYALGVVLHEALSGVPASRHTPGRPRSPLLMLGAAVPRALSWLVDRLLSLDPAARPRAEECEALLSAVAARAPLAPAPWPEPPVYVGDPTRLLAGSAVVVGAPGSGRRRMVQEARWHWFRRGYRSLAGHCRADQPFGALRQILRELFAVADPAARRALAGPEAAVLQAIWPDLPVQVDRPAAWPPDPVEAAAALAATFGRAGPLAVVLWQADQADIGTATLLPPLARALPDTVPLWATARRPVAGLRPIQPPPWGAAEEAEVVAALLPPGAALPPGESKAPLWSCARAWRALAAARGEAGPFIELSGERSGWDLPLLSLLEEPFPAALAHTLSPHITALIEAGHLTPTTPDGAPRPAGGRDDDAEATDTTDLLKGAGARSPGHLRFADRGTRKLAAALADRLPDATLRVAQATLQMPPSPDRALRVAQEALDAGVIRPEQLAAAVRVALDRGNPAELDRWLQLQELHGGADDWLSDYARLIVNFERLPPPVRRAELRQLAARAESDEQRALSVYLQVRDEARAGDPRLAIQLALPAAAQLSAGAPRIASMLLREVSLCRLELGAHDEAVDEALQARQLARIAAGGRGAPLSHAEVEAGTTLSAALIYTGRLGQAAEFCAAEAERCAEAGLPRGEGALQANLAIAQLYAGDRAGAADAAARCRAVQARHGDPLVAAINMVTSARLAVELGDLVEGHTRLDEALTLARALNLPAQQWECHAIALESALQRADQTEARRALRAAAALPQRGELDPWPAALGRWRWMTGDLAGALEATALPRRGHGAAAAHVERARLWLVSGQYERAGDEAEAAAALCAAAGFAELQRFAELVAAAAAAVDDAAWAQRARGTGQSRWVHLYLGALHLDAIRRRLRRENVDALLRVLRQRAQDVGHKLYEALAREEGW
jgi:hypothetical protein